MTMSLMEFWTKQPRPMCGGCKATGIKHVWNAQADMVPVEPHEPCPACNGSGWLGEDFKPKEKTNG
jgi:hypothetical protein